MKKQKILAGLLAFAFCMPMLHHISSDNIPLSATAEEIAEQITVNGAVYEIIDNEAYLVDISNSTEKLIIPAEVNGYPLIALKVSFCDYPNLAELDAEEGSGFESEDGVLFYEGKKRLKAYPPAKSGAYTIPEGVTSIEAFAFENAVQLTSLKLSDTLVSVGTGAFRNCTNLEEIIGAIPGVEGNLFHGCSSLKYVEFASATEDTVYLSDLVFSGCTALEEVVIPEDRIVCGTRALFLKCPALKELNISCISTDTAISIIECGIQSLSLSNTGYVTILNCDELETLSIIRGRSSSKIEDCILLKEIYVYGGSMPSVLDCPQLTTSKFYATTELDDDILSLYNNADYGVICSDATYTLSTNYSVQGDANGDGKFGVTDIVMMQKYLFGSVTLTNWQNVDYNGDGVVNVFDMVLMKRALLEQS